MNQSAPNFRLDGKRALVTGAGRGIGLAIARAYAGAGAHVTLCARSEHEIANVAAELCGHGYLADILPIDVTDVRSTEAAVEKLPPFDIFMNNAGTNRPKPLFDVTEEDFDAVVGLNVRAAIFAARAVAQGMVAAAKGGSIINMSSQMGHVGAANRTLYCASKWAIEGFTKAFAVEMGAHNIRVNTICPTFIETPMTRPFFEDAAFRESVVSKIKLGRLGTPDDVIGAAIFLASDSSSLMTGSALMLDGGWTAG